MWRRADYERLFDAAPATSVRGESTPFYLWHRAAQRRIAEHLPDARLVAVVRDPIDRAYSNWMHLWSDGLEPEADFEVAFAKEHERIAKGWAPFWRYARARQVRRAARPPLGHVEPAPGAGAALPQRSSTTRAGPSTGRVSSSASPPARWTTIPQTTPRVRRAGPAPAVLGRVVRVGSLARPVRAAAVWRKASKPRWSPASRRRRRARPKLAPEVRARLLPDLRRRHQPARPDHRGELRRLALDRESRFVPRAPSGRRSSEVSART